MKTKYYIFLILLFLLVSGHTWAQKIEWSKTINEDLSYDYVKILGADENGYYVLKSNLPFEYKEDNFGLRKKKFSIAYFDNNMGIKMQKPFITQKNGRIHKVLFVNEKVLLLTTTINKERKQYEMFAQWVNNSGISLKSPVKIETISYESKSDITDVQVIVSKDQNLFCIINPNDADLPNKQVITATTVDTNLNVVWSKPIEVPYDEKQFETIISTISNDGDFYMLGSKFSGHKRQRSPGDSYIIFSYNYKKGIRSETPINIEENPLSDVTLTFDNRNKKLMIAGFYFDKNSYAIVGTFYAGLEMDKTNITDVKLQRFDDHFIDGFTRSRQYSNYSGTVNYSINRLILRNDGGVVILAEANYITQISYYDYFTRTFINRNIYHYENILTVSINPDGKIDWQQTIQKNQESQEDGGYFSSYCSINLGNKMILIYNSSIDRTNTILQHTISNKGDIDQNILISESERVLLVPRGALQIDENVLIVPAYKERKFCYAKITF